MTGIVYEVLQEGLADTSKAPRGKDLLYRCQRCGGILPSQPKVSVGCGCGNIVIDLGYFRLSVEYKKKFQVVRLATPPQPKLKKSTM
jgi:hypothetical protein